MADGLQYILRELCIENNIRYHFLSGSVFKYADGWHDPGVQIRDTGFIVPYYYNLDEICSISKIPLNQLSLWIPTTNNPLYIQGVISIVVNHLGDMINSTRVVQNNHSSISDFPKEGYISGTLCDTYFDLKDLAPNVRIWYK